MRPVPILGVVPGAVRGALCSRGWRGGALILTLLASGWLTGCARAGQLRECGRVISTVNDSLASLEKLAKPTDSAAPGTLAPKPAPRKLEAAYKQLARDLDQLEVGNAELKAQVVAYQALLNRAARGVSSLARARNTKDASDVDEATQTMTQIKSAALGTNAQINRICQSGY